MTSYLSENEAENLQNDDVHLAQIAYFGLEYLELEPFGALRSVMPRFFAFFHTISFELNFFRLEFPFNPHKDIVALIFELISTRHYFVSFVLR